MTRPQNIQNMWVADSVFSVSGGRYIGEEFFTENSHIPFSQLDVLLAGKVVNKQLDAFDEHWNGVSTIPFKNFAFHKKGIDETGSHGRYRRFTSENLSRLDV